MSFHSPLVTKEAKLAASFGLEAARSDSEESEEDLELDIPGVDEPAVRVAAP